MEQEVKDYKDELVACMKAISILDGAVRYIHGSLREDKFIYEQIDTIQSLLSKWYEEVK